MGWFGARVLISAPQLNLIHWRRRGDGRHFDVLEFRRAHSSSRPVASSSQRPLMSGNTSGSASGSHSHAAQLNAIPITSSGVSSSCHGTATSSNDAAGDVTPLVCASKRAGDDYGPGRKLFKLADGGKIYRVRDNMSVHDISASSRGGTK